MEKRKLGQRKESTLSFQLSDGVMRGLVRGLQAYDFDKRAPTVEKAIRLPILHMRLRAQTHTHTLPLGWISAIYGHSESHTHTHTHTNLPFPNTHALSLLHVLNETPETSQILLSHMFVTTSPGRGVELLRIMCTVKKYIEITTFLKGYN